MRRPGFFLVGAPKCGTTALYHWLREHPRVYLPTEKEPNYFCSDLPGIRRACTERAYLRLFRQARPGHLAVGEGSVRYLYSRDALPRLRAFRPDARILVLLRNPVDLAHAFHAQALYALHEDEPDFATAWALQDERARRRSVPATCAEPALLQYRPIARLGEQMARLYALFPREQVFVRLYDDLAIYPRRVYEDALAFLGVPTDGRTAFPRVNAHKRLRNRTLAALTERPPGAWLPVRAFLHRVLGVDRLGVLDGLRRWNAVETPRLPLDPAFRAHLTEEFRPDVERLAALIGRDLTPWLAPAPEAPAP